MTELDRLEVLQAGGFTPLLIFRDFAPISLLELFFDFERDFERLDEPTTFMTL